MALIAQRARARLAWWEHVTGGTHWLWERLGQAFDGRLGWRGTIPEPCHTTRIPRGEDLTAVGTWACYDLWRLLR